MGEKRSTGKRRECAGEEPSQMIKAHATAMTMRMQTAWELVAGKKR